MERFIAFRAALARRVLPHAIGARGVASDERSTMIKKRAAGVLVALGLALPLAPAGVFTPLAVAAQAPAARVAVTGLEVNHLTDQPVLGIDDPKPVFCWGMDSNLIGAKQKSYRIEVSRDRAFRNLAWDSGTITSDESTDIS